MSRLTDGRLGIYKDSFADNAFVVRTSELTFARVNLIAGKWRAWFCTKKLQKDFPKLRDALADINKEFISYFRGDK